MTQTTKEIFEKYQVRKTKKQKTAFIEYIQSVAQQHGYECHIEKGALGSRNIVVGDVENAKAIYTAHYDTCARLPFPNFLSPKNIFLYLLYQIIIIVPFFVFSYLFGFLFGFAMGSLNINQSITLIVVYLFFLMLLWLMLFGPANKNTANDNTSGVTTLLDIMLSLPESEKGKIAFVFFDLEEMGMIGSSSFASKHKKELGDKMVLNFDCVSDGETVLFAMKKSSRKYKDILASAFVSNQDITVDIATKGVFFPSDNSCFKGGIGVAALKKSKKFGFLYVDKIHTIRDTVYREENIEFLTNGAVKLAQML